MTIKSKLTGALFAALTIAAPLAMSATPADAAPRFDAAMRVPHDDHGARPVADMRHDDRMARMPVDTMHDRDHRPPLRIEYRVPMPRGHYRWHAGAWGFSHGHRAWQPGVWARL